METIKELGLALAEGFIVLCAVNAIGYWFARGVLRALRDKPIRVDTTTTTINKF